MHMESVREPTNASRYICSLPVPRHWEGDFAHCECLGDFRPLCMGSLMEPPGYGQGFSSRRTSESPYFVPLVELQKVPELGNQDQKDRDSGPHLGRGEKSKLLTCTKPFSSLVTTARVTSHAG